MRTLQLTVASLLGACLAIAGCGRGDDGVAPQTPPITEGQARQFLDTGQSASERFIDLLDSTTADEARTRTLVLLRTAPDVEKAGIVGDSTTIGFRMKSGAEGYIVTDLSDMVETAIPVQYGPGLRSGPVIVQEGPENFESPNLGPALLMDAWGMEPDDCASEVRILTEMGYEPDSIHVLPSASVTRSSFRGLAKYSMIEFYGHGKPLLESSGTMLLLRERCPDAVALLGTFAPDTPVWWEALAPLPHFPVYFYYGVTANYVKRVGGSFRRSVAVLNACYSLRDSGFPSAFGSTSLVLGWADGVTTGEAANATDAVLRAFWQMQVGAQARSTWAQYHDLSGGAGRSEGSGTVCLVANLVGSWYGEMSPPPTGDPHWGLTISRYGSQDVQGRFVMMSFTEGANVSRRGTEFTVGTRSPDGQTRDLSMSVGPGDRLRLDSVWGRAWEAARLSRRADYDTIPPILEDYSPRSGTVPLQFDVVLRWDEPMGNWWNGDVRPENGNCTVSNWRYDVVSRTTRYRVDVTPGDPDLPTTLYVRHRDYCDIWGNYCGVQAAATLSVTR